MQYTKARVAGCCGSKKIVYSLSAALMKNNLPQFQNSGFTILPSYTQAGMLYAENNSLIVIGKFGSTTIEVKCKLSDCDDKTLDLERLLDAI